MDFSKLDISQANRSGRPKKKKRKIIIHSSPYLRCVQTSTAIAAGITQFHPSTAPHLTVPTPHKERNSSLSAPTATRSPHPKSPLSRPPKTLELLADPNLEVSYKVRPTADKILLRIDAFLGEWLSPDYYEDITPPPASTMMVAGAKADLLRRGDFIQEQPLNSNKGHFPGGWVKGGTPTNSRLTTENGPFPTLGSLAQASPFRERSSSQGSTPSLQRSRSKEALAPLPATTGTQRSFRPNYDAPVPSYSVSPADSIPRGYVAHAREACIQVDFQWDSMRPPQDWGDGGEYGDEWSTMHKRFRRGLAGMMQWYREHGSTPPKDQFRGFMFKVLSNKPPPPVIQPSSDAFPAFGDDSDTEDDEELVLILVTHGAGCNALLGAISNQPVLIDVGLASLSMAVRRNQPQNPPASTIHERRLSVADPGMSSTYEMKLLASTDHLRPGVDPSRPPQAHSQSQSPNVVPSPSLDYRRRLTGSPAANSPIESPFSLGEPYRSWNSSLGSVRRTMSSGSTSKYMQNLHSSSETASPSAGLWSSSRNSIADSGSDGRSSPGADMVSSFTNSYPKPRPTAATRTTKEDNAEESNNSLTRLDSKEQGEMNDEVTPLPHAHGRTNSTASSGLWGAKSQPKSGHGLWGPPKLDDVYEHGRGPKRRWTVTEREDGL